jgi:hypothetical protein
MNVKLAAITHALEGEIALIQLEAGDARVILDTKPPQFHSSILVVKV